MSKEKMAPDWLEWDTEYVWHPYTQMGLFPRVPGVDRAEGSYLYLQDGRKVFDAISSWWVTLHGHSHPRITTAVTTQVARLDQVIFAGFTHEPAARLARSIVQRAPAGLTKVFFSDDGSTAVEVALKMALQYWVHRGERRTLFLAIEGCYHGDTFGAMSVSARSPFSQAFEPLLFEVQHLPFPTPDILPTAAFSVAEDRFLEALSQACKTKHNIAGFIFEPLLLGAGGMKVWRKEVLREAMAIALSNGVLTIADEVLTGFGRTGSMLAVSQAGLSPSLLTLSKGLTGGTLPLGLTLAQQDIYDAFLSNDRTKTFFHGHSFTGNPISCATANASLSIFDEEPVFERIQTIEATHRERMPHFATSHGFEWRILGTMAALEATAHDGYLSERFRQVAVRALESGLLIRPLGDTLYFLPPYSSTADDLHAAYDILNAELTV